MQIDAVPLAAYEKSPDAYVLTDSRGRVCMVNAAASALFECDAAAVVGRRCWGVLGLQKTDGAPFCRPRCGVRATLASNEPCLRQRAVRTSRTGQTQELDVFSMKIESRGQSWGVLHLFAPVEKTNGAHGGGAASGPAPEALTRLQRLTRRETEVLRALAAGESTGGIAERLSISPATVRNHIRAILRKLEVGKRLDAVLIWVSQFR